MYDAILAAARRGVQVRVAINVASASNPDTDLYTLMNASSNIQAQFVNVTRFFGAGIIHTKFIVVDAKAFYVGSANLGLFPRGALMQYHDHVLADWRSLTQVKEMGVYVSECSQLATDLLKTFEVYWLAGQATQLPPQWPTYTFTEYNMGHPAVVTSNGTQNNGLN